MLLRVTEETLRRGELRKNMTSNFQVLRYDGKTINFLELKLKFSKRDQLVENATDNPNLLPFGW